LLFQELIAENAAREIGEEMSANKLKRENSDRVIFKAETVDLDHFAIKQAITGNEARSLIDKIGVDLDNVGQAAEKLKQAAARTTLSLQKLSIRQSRSPIPRPLHCRGVRVLDLDPVM
jgi:hypothetical protein